MSVDLSNKKIILVHGLGSKPTPEITHDLWRRTLIENIRVSHKLLAQSLDVHKDIFESAYWANFVPHHIPDDVAYSKKLRLQVDKVIAERREIKDRFHVGTGEKVSSFFKDRGIDLAKLLAGALTVKDDVMTRFLRETELYDQDQYIADQIRRPLEDTLRHAWDQGREPIIVAHSMGTFISYDVLWRFAHRRTSGDRARPAIRAASRGPQPAPAHVPDQYRFLAQLRLSRRRGGASEKFPRYFLRADADVETVSRQQEVSLHRLR